MANGPAATSFPKDQIKILLLENVHRSAHEIFAGEGFQIEAIGAALPEQELLARLEDVHVLGIRSKTQVRAGVLERARRLMAVGCFCIGTNQVDLEVANGRGIPVFNAPFSNTRSVAELMIGEVISLARQLDQRSREMHGGVWRKVSKGCYEVRGKTLGIVGYGRIGSQLGILAEMLGMRVIFYDIVRKLPLGNNHPVEELGELLGRADFVSLHVPATAQTDGMIGEAELARMRKGSFLLNASRGSVVQLGPLAAALRSGQLAGAALDVYPEEPDGNDDPFESELRGLANVILTPHIGGSTMEAQEAIGREVATSLTKYINEGATSGAVNFPEAELKQASGTHRILNVHRNVPGVLRDINRVVSELGANIHSQVLATDANIGYLIMDLDQDVSGQAKGGIAALKTSIKTRILY